ncbi:MAG: hypothetical protein AB7W47_01280 [Calditrichaceae bacterium]
MFLAIQDANIIIDLLNIDMFNELFQLQISFYTTDFVLSEINDEQIEIVTPIIEKELLVVKNSSEEEMAEIIYLNSQVKSLSVADCSVFLLAQKTQSAILTGDKHLRNFASQRELIVHGILWIFDQLVQNKIITTKQAHQKLSLLMSKNKRLPTSECIKRLRAWSK